MLNSLSSLNPLSPLVDPRLYSKKASAEPAPTGAVNIDEEIAPEEYESLHAEFKLDEEALNHAGLGPYLTSLLARANYGKLEVDTLYEELEQWMDNMSGTNLENTEKYQQLEMAIEQLYEIQDLLGQLENYQSMVEFPGMF